MRGDLLTALLSDSLRCPCTESSFVLFPAPANPFGRYMLAAERWAVLAQRRSVVILAIDGVGAKHSGAATVLKSVVEAALRSGRVGRLIVFSSARALRDFDLPRQERFTEIEVPGAESGPAGRARWQLRGLPAATRSHNADALLCLSGGGLAPGRVPLATLIQQSLPFSAEALATLPWTGKLRMRAIRWNMRLSCRRAALVLVQTATMKRWVTEAFGLAADRVQVVEPSPDALPASDPAPALAGMRAVLPGLRLLYVGNESPYKNLRILPAAIREVRRRISGATLFATVAPGHPIAREAGIVALPHLNRGALREAYELSAVLVMPSLVETVGLPMLEAASLGIPVVAADRPYARDVCGDAALFFDPLGSGYLANALVSLLGDGALRAALSSGGRALADARSRARPYDRMIDLVLNLAISGGA